VIDMATVNEALRGVEEVAAPPANEFRVRYALPGRPVILRGFLRDWPAYRKWSIETLADRFATCEVEVMCGPAEIEQDRAVAYPQRRKMTMGDFATVAQCRAQDVYLVAQSQLLRRSEFAALWRDMLFDPDWFSAADAHVGVSLWVGPANTLTPMHHDLQDVLLAQVGGTKRVLLADKVDAPWMYAANGSGYGRVDPEKPDLNAFPLFRNVSLWEAVIDSGDALFLPSGWWHHVRSLSASISLSLSNFAWRRSGDR
jgi:ribosomal protein L16 Arg81 hydroxylase